jgi:hypothetical protein
MKPADRLGTNSLVLVSVCISQLDAFGSEMLLHRGIDGQFLRHGVARKAPHECVSPLDLFLQALCSFQFVGVAVDPGELLNNATRMEGQH